MSLSHNLKRVLASLSLATCCFAAIPGQSMAEETESPVQVSVYGQINRMMLYTDDGKGRDLHFADNEASPSRFGLEASAQLDENWSSGCRLEAQLDVNSSMDVSQLSDSTGSGTFAARKAEWWLTHTNMGTLTLGHGSTASDYSTEKSLSGTHMVSHADVAEYAGGTYLLFAGDTVPTAGVNPQIKDKFRAMDGLGRADRIRYDSPEFSGFVLSASAVEAKSWDVALSYYGRLADMITVDGAFAYAYAHDWSKRMSGSIAFLHDDSGFNMAFSGASDDLVGAGLTLQGGNKKPCFYFGQIGWKSDDILSCGTTAFALHTWHGKNRSADGEKAQNYGAGVQQEVDKLGMTFYAGAGNYKVKRVNPTKKVWCSMVGASMKF